MEGITLAARFSSAPNALGLCGPQGFDSSNKQKLLAQMKKFLAPYSYMQLIAKSNGKKPFDFDVAEAFWIGNSLLDNVKRADLARLITTKFTGKGKLSPRRAKQLAANLPPRVFPHHSFHVFYIGSISGVLEGKKKELDLCRISWGRVSRVGKKSIQVCQKPVAFGRGGATFARRKTASILLPKLCPKFKVGDKICSHWGVAAAKLTRHQEKNLQKYTAINMSLYANRPQR